MKNYRWILVILCFFIFSPALQAQVDNWPREYIGKNGGHGVFYQPQLESWDNYTTLIAMMAAGVSPPGSKTPVLGTLKLSGTTEVDQETRKVRIKDIQITEVNFPTLDPKLLPQLTEAVQQIIPKDALVVSLDRMLANLERSKAPATVDVRNDPPPIYFSTKPAVLVILDGQPIWSPVAGTQLKYAVNTNWDLFQDATTQDLYLLNDGSWLKSKKLYGPWEAAGTLPPDFSQLPKGNENWQDVLAAIPGKPLAADQLPTVFVSPTPAEMIVTQGAPVYKVIPGTQLAYAENTDSNFFFDYGTRNYYFLVSGRWFSHTGEPGAKWVFASDKLPADFRNIPDDSPKAELRASIPGTPESAEAVIAAEIPQKATVKRDATASVEYAGEPDFKPIEKTDLKYATNTAQQVIEYKGKYYLVKDGVWFLADSPKGPWSVADKVPQEIYSIPPSSSLYNVTYVKIYDSNADTVTTGYTAGYMGAFIVGTAIGAALTYGSGWYYPPYYYGAAYYPRPYTYGSAAYYNPWTGGYYGGSRYYGPYGGAGYGASYNPATGTYARGAAAYGPYGGYRAGAQAYNPYTNTYGQTRQGGNAYSHWGSSYVQQGDDWARTARYSQGDRAVSGFQTSSGQSGALARGQNGFVAKGDDLYAGKNGNVYRKTDSGWQKYDNGSWSNTDAKSKAGLQGTADNSNRREQASEKAQARNQGANTTERQAAAQRQAGQAKTERNSGALAHRDSTTSPEVQNRLNRDSSSRDRGNQKVSQFNNYQHSSGGRDFSSARGGGFERGGGGGFRGGGGGGGGFRGGGGRRR